MAIRSISQLKSWFKKGMYPTESQFGDWLDSFFHREDKIPVGSVDGLAEAINRKAEKSDVDTLSQSVSTISAKADSASDAATSALGDAQQALSDAATAQQAIDAVKDDIPYRFETYYKRCDVRPEKPGISDEGGLSGSWVSTPEGWFGTSPLWVIFCWWSSTAVNGSFLRMLEGPFPVLEDFPANDFTTEEKQKLAQQSGVNTGDQDLSGLQTRVEKNQANGYAGLDEAGKIPSVLLPSYVDDVLEFASLATLPAVGESGKIYITTNDNKQYRWSGSGYVNIAASPGTTDSVTEGATNLYFTEGRVRNTLLTGISFLVNQAISATDSALGALGKLQAQIAALSTGKIDKNGTDSLMTAAEHTKLGGISEGANNYIHPTSHPASMIALAQNKTLVGNSQGMAGEADVIPEWTVGANQPGQKEAKGLVMEAVVSDGSVIAIPIIVRKAVSLTSAGQIQILNDSYAGMFYVIKSITLIARNLASVTQYPTLSVGCNSTWNDIAVSQTLNALASGTNSITLTANAGKSLIEANANMVLNVATPMIGTGTFKIVVEGYIC